MAAGPMLQASGITVDRGGITVLNGVYFDLMPGEVVALTGENGSGKTTMLEACAGILPLSEGSVNRLTESGMMQIVRDYEGRRNQPPPTGLTLQSDGICGEETVEERL
ncbi:MAG: ATP-binding cassette domain-containing protein, partial [Candidatus Thermoplasmatota archaeon]|nr:ATP-binding cassette domain-containing protein [Candidatus Thermoplasmatota archaeon]